MGNPAEEDLPVNDDERRREGCWHVPIRLDSPAPGA